jgi:hypothetical protein
MRQHKSLGVFMLPGSGVSQLTLSSDCCTWFMLPGSGVSQLTLSSDCCTRFMLPGSGVPQLTLTTCAVSLQYIYYIN